MPACTVRPNCAVIDACGWERPLVPTVTSLGQYLVSLLAVTYSQSLLCTERGPGSVSMETVQAL